MQPMRVRATAVVTAAWMVVAVGAHAVTREGAVPARTSEFAVRQLDVNRLALRVSNDGRYPFDPLVMPAGAARAGEAGSGDRTALALPRGPGATTVLYAAGLWLGGTLDGSVRVSLGEYASDFLPGSIAIGSPMPLGDPRMTVYKVARWTGNPADSTHLERTAAELAADPSLDPLVHHSWNEYMRWAVPYGAPWRYYRLPVTTTADPDDHVIVPGPDVTGDQMLWSVYRDAGEYEPRGNAHTGSLPLTVEVRQSVFAYDRPGPLGHTAFVRYEILKRGAGTIPDLRVGLWSDPDIGLDLYDDLTGCDPGGSLGFAWNTMWGQDPAFGSGKPVVAFRMLAARSTAEPPAGPLLQAFSEYVNGADPRLTAHYWNLLRGLRQDGTPMTDSATGRPTTYQYPGDPLTGSGWCDATPGNVKMVAATRPLPLGIGDTVVVWCAIAVGQGATPAGSLVAMRCAADVADDLYSTGFAEPVPAPPACPPPATPCPRDADWWEANASTMAVFTPEQWASVASWSDTLSRLIFGLSDFDAYRAMLGERRTAPDSAARELVATLSNVAAGERLHLEFPGGVPAGLGLSTGAQLPPLEGGSLRQVLEPTNYGRGLVDARYEDDVAEHRRALAGTGAIPGFFQTGAGLAQDFMGSQLYTQEFADSFPTVLLRFDRGAGQKAYRYLRFETTGGAAPAGGRGWRYAGHREVPVTAWDLRRGIQVELAFSERAVTDAGGALLGAGAQHATFDSTWAPDTSATGGHEYLWVLNRPYTPVPRPEFAADGRPLGPWPALYALASRLRAPGDVVDDGDGFRFEFGYPPTTSAISLLTATRYRPESDSAAARACRELAASLRRLNLGLGIGPACARERPLSAALVESRVTGSTAHLRWQLAEPALAARLERLGPRGAWLDAGAVALDGAGGASASFETSEPGKHAFRLAAAVPGESGLARSDSAWVDTTPPAEGSARLAPVWPNPARGGARVSFTLPAGGPVKLEVYDVLGRRAYGRDLGVLGAGRYEMEIAPGHRFRPGVYFAVLRAGAERRSARFVSL